MSTVENDRVQQCVRFFRSTVELRERFCSLEFLEEYLSISAEERQLVCVLCVPAGREEAKVASIKCLRSCVLVGDDKSNTRC